MRWVASDGNAEDDRLKTEMQLLKEETIDLEATTTVYYRVMACLFVF